MKYLLLNIYILVVIASLAYCDGVDSVSGATATVGETYIGGYGELHLNNPQGSIDTLDFHRFVLFFGQQLDEKIRFFSEVELEHAFVKNGQGEVELEQAFVDVTMTEYLGVKAGVLLVPMGIINTKHEPPTFMSVERPNVDKYIIPSTWFDGGAGIHGTFADQWDYELYLMGGLDAAGFTAKEGVRGGRQKGYKTTADDLSLTGRLSYNVAYGNSFGFSFFSGKAAQGDTAMGDALTTGIAFDGQLDHEVLKVPGFSLRFEYAQFSIGDADKISAAVGEGIAETIAGFYIEPAYTLLNSVNDENRADLSLFLRYESFDTQQSMPSGYGANKAYQRTALVFGVRYNPSPRVTFKLSYTDNASKADDDPADQLDIGMGYYF